MRWLKVRALLVVFGSEYSCEQDVDGLKLGTTGVLLFDVVMVEWICLVLQEYEVHFVAKKELLR